nr:isoform 2 of probable protein phosphatase 2c 60 [Quercus suber]
MQGWRATMEDAHAAFPDLDPSTSFFGVYDGHGGKVVAKFCAKYLHQQMLRNEAYSAGDIGTSVQKAFFRMDEMMRGQRGWRELAVLGDKINKFTGMIEGLIWSPRGSDSNDHVDEWAFEEGPHSDFAGPTSGSTACVAIIRNYQLIVANAGDSRCVISRKGQAYNLSRDHKPDLEVEKDRILKAGGFIHAGRVNGSLNLARAIGDMEFKQNKYLPAEKQIVTANPDINTVELCDDDDFIVMDEMMRGQRGWRELAVLGDKINKFTGMIEGLIWSPRGSDSNDHVDEWAFEEGPHSDFAGPTSGSTACVAIIRNYQLIVANAGDSRCVISRKGQAYNLSRDHKPDLEVEKDRILKAGGFIHAGRVNGSLNLARAIGDMEFKQNKYLPAEKQIVTANPDINTVELCDDDDFIVLACDGIW